MMARPKKAVSDEEFLELLRSKRPEILENLVHLAGRGEHPDIALQACKVLLREERRLSLPVQPAPQTPAPAVPPPAAGTEGQPG